MMQKIHPKQGINNNSSESDHVTDEETFKI